MGRHTGRKSRRKTRFEYHHRVNGYNGQIQHIPHNSKKYSFFSNDDGTFPRINHILGYKTNLNKFN
jgi:hypothetical protein